jgi:hypothetical protein
LSNQELSTPTKDEEADKPVTIRPKADGDARVTANVTPAPIRLFERSGIADRFARHGTAIGAALFTATGLLTLAAAGLTPITPSSPLNMLMWALYAVTVPLTIALVVRGVASAKFGGAPLGTPYEDDNE